MQLWPVFLFLIFEASMVVDKPYDDCYKSFDEQAIGLNVTHENVDAFVNS